MQETWVRSLGQEDRTEKGMAIHSNILAWRVPRTEEPNDLQSMGHKESDMTERLSLTHSDKKTISLIMYTMRDCLLSMQKVK